MLNDIDLKLETQATKLLFDNKKVIGVEIYNKKTKEIKKIKANKEVISCLGSIGSPQLLMLSKIGNEKHLKDVGVLNENEKAILDQPLVGENLQDHLEVYLQYKCKKPVTLYPVGNWTLKYLHKRVKVGLDWFLLGKGIGASNQFETGGFIRSKIGLKHPDIQYHFIPGAVVGQNDFLPYHAFQIHV